MMTRVSLALLAVLLLAVACAPLPQGAVTSATITPAPASTDALVPTATPPPPTPTAAVVAEATLPPTPAPSAPASGDWQTYDNAEAGFSISYPPGWSQEAMPPESSSLEGVALEGPEGRVELQWGTGFGGACGSLSALHIAQGQIPACYSVSAEGIQRWEQIYRILPAMSFGARAYTKDAAQASADAVLAVLATLTFAQPAASESGPASGAEITVDNAEAGFWPHGSWYYRNLADPKHGADCYAALAGLDATAEVRPELPQAGAYEVFASWCGGPYKDQAGSAVIAVHRSADDAAPYPVGVNYQSLPGEWQSLGVYNLEPSAFLEVRSTVNGSVIADAYRFVPRTEPVAAEVLPTPLPSGPLVSNHPPSPLQQVTQGDLVARLALNDPFYSSSTMTPTDASFDDCQVFPRDGCGGTVSGWQAIVAYQGITLTYKVSSDYRLVAVTGADALDPWMMGQDYPQRTFLSGYGGGMAFRVRYHPDNTWHLLRVGDGTQPDSDVRLTQEQGALLRDLAPKYGTLDLQPTGGGHVTFYGLGTGVAPTDADRDALLALSAELTAMPR